MPTKLVEIRRHPETKSARLTWSDGHAADFPYDYLRGYCPCAGCQGHGAMGIKFHPVGSSVEPLTIEPVGRYGLSFHWSDGHATGIYRFDFLRQICPCSECVAERKEPSDYST